MAIGKDYLQMTNYPFYKRPISKKVGGWGVSGVRPFSSIPPRDFGSMSDFSFAGIRGTRVKLRTGVTDIICGVRTGIALF